MQKTDSQQHCRVCGIDIQDYFEHLKTPQHKVNYEKEVDNEDGVPILNKIDQLFEEMNQN